MNQPLITKYRPEHWDEMIGHEAVLGALRRAIASPTRPHAYLFTGPAGLGKTTLARIVAREIGADVLEIDAASNSGVDDMRELVLVGSHMSLMGSGTRMVIIDECHTLSKSAWQAILKLLEEPPAHLFLALCTTERNKVPETIVSRCYHTLLRPLSVTEITDLLLAVSEMEGWKVNNDVLAEIVVASTGQPRKGLTFLQAAHDAPSREEASRIIGLQAENDAVRDLCQALVSKQGGWEATRKILERIQDDEFETVSILVSRYIMAAMIKAPEAKARQLWMALDALVWPSETYDRKAAFYAAVGRIFWAGS